MVAVAALRLYRRFVHVQCTALHGFELTRGAVKINAACAFSAHAGCVFVCKQLPDRTRRQGDAHARGIARPAKPCANCEAILRAQIAGVECGRPQERTHSRMDPANGRAHGQDWTQRQVPLWQR